MTDELREDVKEVVRSYDTDADDLRTLATDLETLADQWETLEGAL